MAGYAPEDLLQIQASVADLATDQECAARAGRGLCHGCGKNPSAMEHMARDAPEGLLQIQADS